MGIDSVMQPYANRVRAWERIAKDLPMDKLEAMVQMNEDAWAAIAEQRWVPEISLGEAGTGMGEGNAATALLQMMMVNYAKQLDVDMTVPRGQSIQ